MPENCNEGTGLALGLRVAGRAKWPAIRRMSPSLPPKVTLASLELHQMEHLDWSLLGTVPQPGVAQFVSEAARLKLKQPHVF